MKPGNGNIVGATGEDIAMQFLKKRGFRIVARNYAKPWGEIDIIATKGNVVHFVEVKTGVKEKMFSRGTSSYRPEDQVHPGKLRKICRTADLYMNQSEGDRNYQVDVIAVTLDYDNRTGRCNFIENVA